MATWTHNITRQDNAIQGGVDVTVEFERSGTGCRRTCTFHFVNEAQITTEGPASGGLNFSGIIDYVLGLITRAAAGAISFAGTVTRKVNYKRPGCGTLDSSGIIQRSAAYARNVAGGISWSGIVRAVTAGLGMIIDPIITSVTTARTFVSNTIKRIISGK